MRIHIAQMSYLGPIFKCIAVIPFNVSPNTHYCSLIEFRCCLRKIWPLPWIRLKCYRESRKRKDKGWILIERSLRSRVQYVICSACEIHCPFEVCIGITEERRTCLVGKIWLSQFRFVMPNTFSICWQWICFDVVGFCEATIKMIVRVSLITILLFFYNMNNAANKMPL
jgi:hypothetical protein